MAQPDLPCPPRFFIHHDGSFLYYVPPPISLERFVHETVGCLEGTQVDGVICHMFTVGDAVPLYHTEVPGARAVMPQKHVSAHVWKNARNQEAMAAMSSDPWDEAIAAAHRQRKPFWGAMRFNDAHPPEYGMYSQFTRDHPEYRLGTRCGAEIHAPEPDGTVRECRHLDFSIAEVRAHRLQLVEELCGRYDVDGFEWDFTRDSGHNFATGQLEAGRKILTDYLHETRQMLTRLAQKRGRPLGFAARVSGSLQACRSNGLDVERWIKDGLFDMLTPTVYYDTVCELPFDEFVSIARGTSCGIYASVTEGTGPGRFRPPPVEAVRAGALNAWRQEVDGIHLFNFHHHVISNLPRNEALLSEMGDPATLERKDKLYMIAGPAVPSQSRFFGMPYATAHLHQLPMAISVGETRDVVMPIADDVAAARADGVLAAILLRLDLCHLTGDEDLALSVNDQPLAMTHASWQPSSQYPWNWNGMHGHLEACWDLTHGDYVQQGGNRFTLELRARPDDIAPALFWHALRLEITYNSLPVVSPHFDHG